MREPAEERSLLGGSEPLDADQRHQRALVPREVYAGLQISKDTGATRATGDI
jgi:hypothetical protein